MNQDREVDAARPLNGADIKWVASVLDHFSHGGPPSPAGQRRSVLGTTPGGSGTGTLGANIAIAETCYGDGGAGGGVFWWDPSVQWNIDDGGTIIVPNSVYNAKGAGELTGGWRRIFSGALDVTWFGAGGSYSDNTVAIQAAINAAATASLPHGGTVYLPRGIYHVHGPLTIANAVTIFGDGPESAIHFNVPDYGILVTSSNVTIEKLAVTGASASRVIAIAGPQPTDGGSATPISEIAVRSCTISGGTLDTVLGEPAGLWLYNVSDVWIEDNSLSGNGDGNTTNAHGTEIYFTDSFGTATSSGVHIRGNTCLSSRVWTQLSQ